jgi:hypothetical protein
VDLEHRRVLLVAAGGPRQPDHVVALAEAVLARQLDRDVRVALAREEVVDPEEAVPLVADVEVALDADRLVAGRRGLLVVDVEQVAVLTLGPSSRPFLRRRRRRLLRLSPSPWSPWSPCWLLRCWLC